MSQVIRVKVRREVATHLSKRRGNNGPLLPSARNNNLRCSQDRQGLAGSNFRDTTRLATCTRGDVIMMMNGHHLPSNCNVDHRTNKSRRMTMCLFQLNDAPNYHLISVTIYCLRDKGNFSDPRSFPQRKNVIFVSSASKCILRLSISRSHKRRRSARRQRRSTRPRVRASQSRPCGFSSGGPGGLAVRRAVLGVIRCRLSVIGSAGASVPKHDPSAFLANGTYASGMQES